MVQYLEQVIKPTREHVLPYQTVVSIVKKFGTITEQQYAEICTKFRYAKGEIGIILLEGGKAIVVEDVVKFSRFVLSTLLSLKAVSYIVHFHNLFLPVPSVLDLEQLRFLRMDTHFRGHAYVCTRVTPTYTICMCYSKYVDKVEKLVNYVYKELRDGVVGYVETCKGIRIPVYQVDKVLDIVHIARSIGLELLTIR